MGVVELVFTGRSDWHGLRTEEDVASIPVHQRGCHLQDTASEVSQALRGASLPFWQITLAPIYAVNYEAQKALHSNGCVACNASKLDGPRSEGGGDAHT